MKSCFLSEDFQSLDKVCNHVLTHHRNDPDVLMDWSRVAADLITTTRPITDATWKTVIDIVGLMYAKRIVERDCALLVARYALILDSQNQDVMPILNRFTDHWLFGCHFNYPQCTARLRKAVHTSIIEQIEKNHEWSGEMLCQLLQHGVTNLGKFLEKSVPNDQLLRGMWKISEYRDIVRNWFTNEFPLNGELIDWFWRNDPGLFLPNIRHVVQSLISDCYYKSNWFTKDRRLIAFFQIPVEDVLLQLWHNETRLMAKTKILTVSFKPENYREFSVEFPKVLTKINVSFDDDDAQALKCAAVKCRRLPMPVVLKLCKRGVGNAYGLTVYIISTVVSYEIATEFLKTYSNDGIDPLAAKWSLRFAWRQFRDLPSVTNWAFLREMSYRCDSHAVRRVVAIADAPADWLRQVSQLVWEKTCTEPLEWQLKVLRSIPCTRIPLLDPKVRLSFLTIADSRQDVAFIFQCWCLTPDDKHVNQIITKMLCKKYFENSFMLEMMNEAVKTRRVAVLDAAIANLNLPPQSTYSIQFLRLFLTTELEKVPEIVLQMILNGEELMWEIFANALKRVINVTKVPLFWFLRRFVDSPWRLAPILCVFLLPRKVPVADRMVVDPDIQVYEEIVEILRRSPDRVVQVYLFKHFNYRLTAQ